MKRKFITDIVELSLEQIRLDLGVVSNDLELTILDGESAQIRCCIGGCVYVYRETSPKVFRLMAKFPGSRLA